MTTEWERESERLRRVWVWAMNQSTRPGIVLLPRPCPPFVAQFVCFLCLFVVTDALFNIPPNPTFRHHRPFFPFLPLLCPFCTLSTLRARPFSAHFFARCHCQGCARKLPERGWGVCSLGQLRWCGMGVGGLRFDKRFSRYR